MFFFLFHLKPRVRGLSCVLSLRVLFIWLQQCDVLHVVYSARFSSFSLLISMIIPACISLLHKHSMQSRLLESSPVPMKSG
jgi:hypothetical protein